MIVPIQSRDIDSVWARVLPHIERWLAEEGIWSPEGIRKELKAARAQLWCFVYGDIRGVWVTRIDKPDGHLTGLIWGCAGEFVEHKEEAITCFRAIERWMKDKGCELIEIVGRGGWAKVFPDYERQAVVLRKRL